MQTDMYHDENGSVSADSGAEAAASYERKTSAFQANDMTRLLLKLYDAGSKARSVMLKHDISSSRSSIPIECQRAKQ